MGSVVLDVKFRWHAYPSMHTHTPVCSFVLLLATRFCSVSQTLSIERYASSCPSLCLLRNFPAGLEGWLRDCGVLDGERGRGE